MVVEELLKKPGSWLSMGPESASGVIVSSRVRLARNIRRAAFPGWAGEGECLRLSRQIRDALESVPALRHAVCFDMSTLDDVDCEVLKERHLISQDLAEKGAGSALVLSEDERIAVMINEEDHLRLQSMSPGMHLLELWEKINEVDSQLESRLDYAFSPRLGYLTACPSNTGTGLRASVMMHLAGLRLTQEVEEVVHGLDRIGLAVRGLLGEGTEAQGNLFQISNQITLGMGEEDILKRMVRIVGALVQHEENARARLLEDRRSYVLDRVGRVFGTLLYAKMLTSAEATDLLSGLRLGVELGMVGNLTVADINEILLLTQPGHMQKMEGRALDPVERDERRADMVRQRLNHVSMAG